MTLTGMFYISLAMPILTILILWFSWAKTWGKLSKTVDDNTKGIEKVRKLIYSEDGSLNFVIRKEFEEREKDCPVLLCSKIIDVRADVKENTLKIDKHLLIIGRFETIVEQVSKTVEKNETCSKELGKSVNALTTQVAILANRID